MLAQPGRKLPFEYVSPETSLGLRLHVHSNHSHYDLVQRATGTRLATSGSGIVGADIIGGEFCGSEDVTFATDRSGVVITEGLADAGPYPSYILFHRLPNGSFEVRYLKPPTIFDPKCPAPAFSYVHPIATELTAERITFYYPGIRRAKSMLLSDVVTIPTLEPQ